MPKTPTTIFRIPPILRWHKRSWFFAAVLVLIPWILVAGPGVKSGSNAPNFYTANAISYSTYEFGWPLVHAREIRVDIDQGNTLFPPNTPPLTLNPNQVAKDRMANLNSRVQPAWNLRLEPLELNRIQTNKRESLRLGNGRFWSETSNWFGMSTSDGSARAYYIQLLLGNICLAMLTTTIMAAFIEFLVVRRGFRFLQISLAKLLIAIALLAIGIAVVRSEFIRASTEQSAIRTAEQLKGSRAEFMALPSYAKPRAPAVFANLLDNRIQLPGTNVSLWTPANMVFISFLPDDDTPTSQSFDPERIEAINKIKCPIVLDFPFSSRSGLLLESVASANIVEIKYENYFGIRDKKTRALQLDSLVRLPNSMPALKRLTIELDSDGQDQDLQLRPCLELKSLENLQRMVLTNVNKSGFEFLLSNRDRFPKRLTCVFDDELPPTFQQRVQEAGIGLRVFDATPQHDCHPQPGGIF